LPVIFITSRIVIALAFHSIGAFITFNIVLILALISISHIKGNCPLIGFLLTFLGFILIFAVFFSSIVTILVFFIAALMSMNGFD
jgi:hypothetical protein